MSTEKSNDTIWNRTSDLPICSTEQKVKHTPVKCKAISLQGWRGPKGFRRLRLPDFKTTGT
jgi:hypothetical protein